MLHKVTSESGVVCGGLIAMVFSSYYTSTGGVLVNGLVILGSDKVKVVLKRPSRADYSPGNLAWLIEYFGDDILHVDPTTLEFVYDNGEKVRFQPPGNLAEKQKCQPRSKALIDYEKKAKKSKRLIKFQDNSPAHIKYFKPQCPEFE